MIDLTPFLTKLVPFVAILVGIPFVWYGANKLFIESSRERHQKVLENIGLTPGCFFTLMLGVIELVGGLLLISTTGVRPTALVLGVIVLIATIVKYFHPKTFKSSIIAFMGLVIGCLFLSLFNL